MPRPHHHLYMRIPPCEVLQVFPQIDAGHVARGHVLAVFEHNLPERRDERRVSVRALGDERGTEDWARGRETGRGVRTRGDGAGSAGERTDRLCEGDFAHSALW
jgi:hypothetical protein